MTIRDVAEHCGVSISTVSRVLNDHPDVSREVRKRVMDAVRELHYVPNLAARDLVMTGGDSIGLVVRGAQNPFFTPLIRSVEQSIEAAGYTMVLHQIQAGGDELAAAAQLSRSKRLRGLILLGGRFNYTPEETASIDVPFVCCTYTNDFGTIDPEEYSSVSIDDRAEACRAVRLLTKSGHKKIAVLLDSSHDASISELRYQGYKDALAEAGIEPDPGMLIECGSYHMEKAYEKMRSFVSSGKEFTALFCVADSMAIAAMKALHDDGLKVPDDCSVVAIDGIYMSLYTIPTLTTLSQPKEAMGQQAVSILTDILSGKDKHRHIRLSTTLRQGGTVRKI